MAYYVSISHKSQLIITFFILLHPFLHVLCSIPIPETKRETLEVIIGGGFSGGGGGGGGGGGEGGGGVGGGGGCGCGGGGSCNNYCSPPPLPPPPPPQPIPKDLNFSDPRLAIVYPVIQNFKKTIISDVLGVTSTWVGADICSYKGFFCDRPPDNQSATALASIDFNGFELTAPTLDGFLDQLPDIAVFHANSNNFTGTISPKIAQLRYLYELDLSNNKFSGEFPTAVLTMNGLSFLDIRFNSFTGSVPAQLFAQALDFLFVNDNFFLARLPDNLGNTTARYLTLANNKFVGPIPKSIGKAANTLVEVLFLNNQLSGCLPYEIGFLGEATVFDAGSNQLTGPLPCSLGCLEKIEQLNFAGNQLYGAVPEVVCALGNLVNLSLSDNYFTYVGPICRNLIKRGVLDVSKNCILDLASQRSVFECAMFFAHPRICFNKLSYNIIPCKISHWPFPWKIPPRSSVQSKQVKALSPSYSALIRHRRL